MSHPPWTFRALMLLLLGCASVAQTDEPQLFPCPGVLVLRTGSVLRGNILRVGDRYVVTQGKQDEISVPVDRVEMRCDSLEHAYRQKQRQLPPDAKVADHLGLADWCLRYDLLNAAAQQLMAAQRLDPLDGANERFEKRLRLAAHRPATSTPNICSAPPNAVSQPDLDQLVQSLPPGTVERFTTTIQPLLINRCGGGACHGPNADSDFRLFFPRRNRALSRRSTQRNLQITLKQVDADEPSRSPLLMLATLPHGKATKPPLSEDDVTPLHHLAAWIYQSLRNTEAVPPAVLEPPDALLLQPLDRKTSVAANALNAVQAHRDLNQPNAASARSDPAVEPVVHTKPAKAESTRHAFSGTDPFDPELFNRRYLK